jgi:hypothetical protein
VTEEIAANIYISMTADRLRGWTEIAEYLEIHARTAQRYAKTLRLPIRRLGTGPKAPVFALRTELDAWIGVNRPLSKRQAGRKQNSTLTNDQGLAGPILDRINRLTNLRLYRRNYLLRFRLRPSAPVGVRVNLEYRYELCNPTTERQPFMQEVTVDAPDHGYVEEMSFFADGKPIYVLKRPRVTERTLGYSIFRATELLIEPSSRGVIYEGRASWVINRSEDDFWGTHMLMPTIGVAVETEAPTDFDITPSYSTPEMVMTGEHLDFAWKRKR